MNANDVERPSNDELLALSGGNLQKGEFSKTGRGGEHVRIAITVGTVLSALLLSTGVAHADCQTDCYDSGNTGEHCVTTCN